MVVAKIFGIFSVELVLSQDVSAGMELPQEEPVGMPMEMLVGAPEIPVEMPTLIEMPIGVPIIPEMPMGVPSETPIGNLQMMPVQYDMPLQSALPLEMQWPPTPPFPQSYEQPLDMQFASPELQPTLNSWRRSVADFGLKPLQSGQTVCAQAMTGQWWTADVFHDNMDYTYFLLVQDDVQTQWPRIHWADILDKSCSDFYQAELDKEGQQHQHQLEQHQEFHQDQHQEFHQDQHPDLYQQQQEFHQGRHQEFQQEPQEPQEQKETGRWSARKKTRPWGVISAVAVAGSVPVLYHLTGAAGPAA